RKAHNLRRLGLWAKRNKGWAAAFGVSALAVLLLGAGGLVLGKNIAAHAKAESEHFREKQVEAEQRARILQREALVQDIERINLTPHHSGWRKLIDSKVVQGTGLGKDDGRLRGHAIGALRDLDAVPAKDLPYGASALAFDPQGRRLFSCSDQDQ